LRSHVLLMKTHYLETFYLKKNYQICFHVSVD